MTRWPAIVALLVAGIPTAGQAHGGVVSDNDLCIISIGYLRAHFKIYVPAETAHRDYCEDIPVRGESIFVMEYEHGGLDKALIDFRIIRNVTGKGRFARLEDVTALDDVDRVTVYHQPPAVVPDVYTALYDFDSDGEYIGIVSASTADTGKSYTAVFPFEVGSTGLGVWPWIIGGLVLLQLNFWFFSRRRKSLHASHALLLGLALLASPPADASDTAIRSDAGYFTLQYVSELVPIRINTIHSWTLTIQYADGRPVADATVTITGGMPRHNHGLPTRPAIHAGKTPGDYRVDGLRFHMQGDWVLHIQISDGRLRDTVSLPLQLQP